MTNYNLLRGAIISKGYTFETFAEALGIGRRTLTLKASGKRDFDQKEILHAKKLLDLTEEQVMKIFFADEVPD